MLDVTAREFKGLIKFAARVRRKGINLPVFAWGGHGVGKTEIVGQAAFEMDYALTVLNLANQTPEDLLGNAVVDRERRVVDFYPPGWLGRSPLPTVYFLDEPNRAPKYVLQAMFNFINEGRIHEHRIRGEDIVVLAGNPGGAEYEVTGFMDEAWLSRFCHVAVNPTAEEVASQISSKNGSGIGVAMLRNNPDLCSKASKVSEEGRFHVQPDNRNVERIDRLLGEITLEEFELFGEQMLHGLLGKAAEEAVTLYRKRAELPSPGDLMEGRVDVKSIDPSRVDMVGAVSAALIQWSTSHGVFKGNTPSKYKKVLCRWLRHAPQDQAVMFIRLFRDVVPSGDSKAVEVFEEEGTYLRELLEVENRFKREIK